MLVMLQVIKTIIVFVSELLLDERRHLDFFWGGSVLWGGKFCLQTGSEVCHMSRVKASSLSLESLTSDALFWYRGACKRRFNCIQALLAFLFLSNVELKLVSVQQCGHFGPPSVRVAEGEGTTINSDHRPSWTWILAPLNLWCWVAAFYNHMWIK